jgi:hypothetical protein
LASGILPPSKSFHDNFGVCLATHHGCVWLSCKGIVRSPLLVAVLSLPGAFVLAGLLKVGVPKPWDESKKDLGYIRKAGVRQFISTYNRVKDLQGDELLWGDEIEYGVFKLDHEQKKVRLSLRAKEVSSSVSVFVLALLKLLVSFHLSHSDKIRRLTLFCFNVPPYLDHG